MADTTTVLCDCKAGSSKGDVAVWEFWFAYVTYKRSVH